MEFKGPFTWVIGDAYSVDTVRDAAGLEMQSNDCADLLNTLTAERDALKAERDQMREKLREFDDYLNGRTERFDFDDFYARFPFLAEEPKP